MTHSRLPLALAAAIAALAALPGDAAAAGLQDDIKTCGAAAVENGLIEEDGTRLRFVSDRGNRNRTLVLKALRDEAEDVTVSCLMKRRDVIEVVLGDA